MGDPHERFFVQQNRRPRRFYLEFAVYTWCIKRDHTRRFRNARKTVYAKYTNKGWTIERLDPSGCKQMGVHYCLGPAAMLARMCGIVCILIYVCMVQYSILIRTLGFEFDIRMAPNSKSPSWILRDVLMRNTEVSIVVTLSSLKCGWSSHSPGSSLVVSACFRFSVPDFMVTNDIAPRSLTGDVRYL